MDVSSGLPAVVAPAVEISLDSKEITEEQLSALEKMLNNALTQELALLNLKVWYVLTGAPNLMAFLECDLRTIGDCDNALQRAKESSMFLAISKDVSLFEQSQSIEQTVKPYDKKFKLGLSVLAALNPKTAKKFSTDLNSLRSALHLPVIEQLLDQGFRVTGVNLDKHALTGYLMCSSTKACEENLKTLQDLKTITTANFN
jgi:hypothetical protein